jgi:hypothetical protein
MRSDQATGRASASGMSAPSARAAGGQPGRCRRRRQRDGEHPLAGRILRPQLPASSALSRIVPALTSEGLSITDARGDVAVRHEVRLHSSLDRFLDLRVGRVRELAHRHCCVAADGACQPRTRRRYAPIRGLESKLIERDADPIIYRQVGGDRVVAAAQVLHEGMPGLKVLMPAALRSSTASATSSTVHTAVVALFEPACCDV